jgi:hypothetical protein
MLPSRPDQQQSVLVAVPAPLASVKPLSAVWKSEEINMAI